MPNRFQFMILFAAFLSSHSLSFADGNRKQKLVAGKQAKAIEAAVEVSNKAFEKKMKNYYNLSKRIRIDGNSKDWLKLPQFEDPKRDVKDPTIDVVKVGLMGNEKYIDVMVMTSGKPSAKNFGINVILDIAGDYVPEVMISIKNNQLIARYYDQKKKNLDPKSIQPLKRSQVRIGRTYELRVNLAEIMPKLSMVAQKEVKDPTLHPIIRAQIKCWDGKSYAEVTPKVAAYRVTAKPYNYYGKLPYDVKTSYAINMPLQGRWYLGQGAHTDFTHVDKWAYDFWIVGPNGSSRSTNPPTKLSHYYCYGKAIISPLAGKVTFTQDGHPDQPAGSEMDKNAKGNALMIKDEEGLEIYMTHLLKGTIKYKKGDDIKVGDFIGKIGNSGWTKGPHLHLAGYVNGRRGENTQPLALKNVRVGINNFEDDPWAREEKFWPMREGFFVTKVD